MKLRNQKVYLTVLLFVLSIVSLGSVFLQKGVFHQGSKAILQDVWYGIMHPNLSKEVLIDAVEASWITLSYAVVSITIATVFGLVLGTIASGVIFKKTKHSWISKLVRILLAMIRSIHELVWAWLFVASIGLNATAAVLALAIPYAGSLGRIFADMLADVDSRRIQVLETNGASILQKLMYGYYPSAFANMTSYTLYRFECAVRSSTILSFVGVVGIGYMIQLSLFDLDFSRLTTYLIALILLVLIVDKTSSTLRKKWVDVYD